MSNIEVFKDTMGKRESEFLSVLGNIDEWLAFKQTAITLIGAHPEWLTPEYNQISLLQCCMYAAQTHLSLDPSLGHVYFVPRKKKGMKHICFQIGYKGMMKLAYQSGHVAGFSAEPVFEGDEFDYELGTNGFIRHKPKFKHDTQDKLLFAWARAILKPAGECFIVIPAKEVQKSRSLSDSSGSDFSPWNRFYLPMVRKTAVRRLTPFLDLCVELHRAVGIEEQEEAEFLKDARPRNALEALGLPVATEPKSPVDTVDAGRRSGGPTDASGEPEPSTLPPPAGDSLFFPEEHIPKE
jgi:recombination protein RecT